MTVAPNADLADVQVGRYGLRTFEVDSSTGQLRPVARIGQSQAWRGGVCVATCTRCGSTPGWDCGCGVYSWDSLETLRRQYVQAQAVVAVVALEGRVVEGSSGTRAEAARVVGLWLHPHRVPAVLAAKIRRNVPDATVFEDVDELVTAYPGLRYTAAAEQTDGRWPRRGRVNATHGPAPRWRGWWPLAAVRRVVVWALRLAPALMLVLSDRVLDGDAWRDRLGPNGSAEHPTTTAVLHATQAVTDAAAQVGTSAAFANTVLLSAIVTATVFAVVAGAGLFVRGRAHPRSISSIGYWSAAYLEFLLVCAVAAYVCGRTPTILTDLGVWFPGGVVCVALVVTTRSMVVRNALSALASRVLLFGRAGLNLLSERKRTI